MIQARSLALLASLLAAPAAARPPQTLDIEQIRPGDKGYGLTVFSGYRIERFKVEVIDILRGFLPKQDLILMRGEHPVLARAGVLAGMSGSPIYIRGKLVGALAWGWRFAKDPVFGVTPIKNMMGILGRPRRRKVSARPIEDLAARWLLAERRAGDPWWRLPFDRAPRPHPTEVKPLAVPLSVAGVSSTALARLRETFGEHGLEAVRAGGAGGDEGPRRFEPGGAIGVELVAGDISMTGTGTVTWTDGKRVLAFGHGMFNAGEIYLPVVSARINHSLGTLSGSIKLSSPGQMLGSLVQDRQAGIMATIGERATTVPATVRLRAGRQRSSYEVTIARHRLLTPTLIGAVIANAAGEAMADVARVTFDIETRLRIAGHPQIVINEQHFASTGLRILGAMAPRGVAVVRLLLDNPFEPVALERVEVDIDVHFGETPLRIVAASVATNKVRAGETVPLRVTFRPFDGQDFSKSYDLQIPPALSGSILVAEVATGSAVTPDLAPPENLEQLLETLPKRYPARSVVISLKTPVAGVRMRGHVIRDLPQSVLDSIRGASQVRTEKLFKTAIRQVHRLDQLVVGKQEIRLRVENEAGE